MSFILILQRIIRHASAWLVLLTLLGLSGCSAVKLAYNQSDDLMYWWLDAYVDFQDEQKQFTREALADLQRWHRQNQLPEYVTLLQKMRNLAPNDVTPSQVCAITYELQASFVTLLRHVEPSAAQLVTQLKPEQLRQVRKRYDKTNKEWRSDWLEPDAEERLRYRTKLSLSRLEDFYGRLEKPQRDVLQKWLGESVFDPTLSFAERERRQVDSLQTFQRVMQDGKDATQHQALLRGWIDRSLNSPNEQHRAYNKELWNENCEGFAKLHNSTTPAQRQRMVEALRGYEQDFKILMTQK